MLHDCVMNRTSAIDAIRLALLAAGAESFGKAPQALRAGNRNACIGGKVVCVAMNPERRVRAGKLVGMPLHLGQCFHDPQQGEYAAALLVKRIGGDAGRHLVAGERAAHGDRPDRGKPAANHREQFEA